MKPQHNHTLNSKVSGDDCGGGSGSFNMPSHTHTSSRHMIFQAIKVLALCHDYSFRCVKDRDQHCHGNIDVDDAIKMMARMIAMSHFQGSMDMFQETIAMKIVEKINEVLDGTDIVPKGDIDNASSIQGSSSRDGFGRNSILQRFVQIRR